MGWPHRWRRGAAVTPTLLPMEEQPGTRAAGGIAAISEGKPTAGLGRSVPSSKAARPPAGPFTFL